AAAAARTEPVTLRGVTFSDELGGFVLLGGSGSGTPADPFVVLERIATNAPTVLVIRGVDLEFGNPVRTNHFVGFAMTKVVENATGDTWNGYRLELEKRLGHSSPRLDGLSFGQEYPPVQRSFSSDRFAVGTVLDEPYDGIAFGGGAVAPGDRVAFDIIITDNAPKGVFYLVQRHEQSISRARW
ncbi:MAG: hypothetical protein V3R98_06485, partial [Alphaproteobacteria bacterium]